MGEIVNLNGEPVISEQKQEELKAVEAEKLKKLYEERQAAIEEAMKKIEEERVPLTETSIEYINRIKAITEVLNLKVIKAKTELQNMEFSDGKGGIEKKKVPVPVSSFEMSIYDTFQDGPNMRSLLFDRLYELVIKL